MCPSGQVCDGDLTSIVSPTQPVGVVRSQQTSSCGDEHGKGPTSDVIVQRFY